MHHLIDLQKKALSHLLPWKISDNNDVSAPRTNREPSAQDLSLEVTEGSDSSDGESRSDVNRSTTLEEAFENTDANADSSSLSSASHEEENSSDLPTICTTTLEEAFEDTDANADSSSLSSASHEEENSSDLPTIWGPFQYARNAVLNNPIFRVVHVRVAASDDLSAARSHTDPITGERDPFRGAHDFVLNEPVIQCIHYITDDDDAGVIQSVADPAQEEPQHSFHGAHHFIRNNLFIQYIHRSSVAQPQTHPGDTHAPHPIWAPFYNARNVVLRNATLMHIDATGFNIPERPSSSPKGTPICGDPFRGTGDIIFKGGVFGFMEPFVPTLDYCRCSFVTRTERLHLNGGRVNVSEGHGALKPPLLVGAELDSKLRRPLPRCHPGTREALRGEITDWLLDKDRRRGMLWLFGPAGVGKSAVAQVIGEYAAERSLLGGAIFLSRTKKLDDPAHLIASISYQLATGNRPYSWFFFEALLARITTVWKDSQTQFKELIVEPFSAMKRQGYVAEKLLIIIDGLDECRGDKKQLDFVELVIENLKSPAPLPLLWMICSRPEQHFKDLFMDGSLLDLCWERDLLLSEPGAQEDVELYLKSELEHIGKKYHDRPRPRRNWSVTEKALKKLVKASAGLFVYASTIRRFIGDPDIADPASQLELILKFLDGFSDVFGDNNPLGPIDMLYLGVLGEVETDHLPTSLGLVASRAVYPPIPALHLVNLLGVDSESFYLSLRKLHSVLAVPHPSKAHEEPLHFYHASFPDFLLHPTRSKEYSQDPDLCRSWLIRASLCALSETSVAYSRSLSWRPSNLDEEGAESPPALSISHEIRSLVATHSWDVLTQVSNPKLEFLRDTVVNFDFSRLQSICEVIPVDQFISFLRWLYALRNSGQELMNFVRANPCSDIDKNFVEKCRPLSQPLNLESQNNADQLEEAPRYVLVGFEPKTVVVLVIPEAVMIYSADDIQKL